MDTLLWSAQVSLNPPVQGTNPPEGFPSQFFAQYGDAVCLFYFRKGLFLPPGNFGAKRGAGVYFPALSPSMYTAWSHTCSVAYDVRQPCVFLHCRTVVALTCCNAQRVPVLAGTVRVPMPPFP